MTLEENHREVLAVAAAPILARIQRDATRLEEPTRAIVWEIYNNLLQESFNVKTILEAVPGESNTRKTKFRLQLGLPISKYIERARLEIAIRLLGLNSEIPIREVAALVGYRLEHTFMVAFKRFYNLSPGKARAKLLKHELGQESFKKTNRSKLSKVRTSPDTRPANRHADKQARREEALDQRIFSEIIRPALSSLERNIRRLAAEPHLYFTTDVLFRGLLAMSRSDCREDRSRGVELAEAALDVLHSMRGFVSEEEYADMEVEGLANLGNARRLASDWVSADRAFKRADFVAAEHQVSGKARAFLCLCQGHLRTFQRRFTEAYGLLDEAYSLQSKLGNHRVLGQTLLARGQCSELQGSVSSALEDYTEALRIFEMHLGSDRYLLIGAHQHLANAHGLLNDYTKAEEHLTTTMRLASEVSLPSEVADRILWLEGLLDSGRGHLEKACRKLKKVSEGLRGRGERKHAAVLDLDLARLKLELVLTAVEMRGDLAVSRGFDRNRRRARSALETQD